MADSFSFKLFVPLAMPNLLGNHAFKQRTQKSFCAIHSVITFDREAPALDRQPDSHD